MKNNAFRHNVYMPEVLCRHFNGYKPCSQNAKCDSACAFRSIPQARILIVHLGAIGAVVRSTSLLSAINRKYPGSHITWVTQRPSDQLLRENSQIDRVLTTERDDLLSLSCLEFDVGFCIDKSLVAAGILKTTKVKKIFGFRAETITGAIVPATDAALPLWEIGLSNQKKFFDNKKPETQLVTEALELEYCRDPYSLQLNKNEIQESLNRRSAWASPNEIVVGVNTGCSAIIPYKKLSVEAHRRMIQSLKSLGVKIVLLGGAEDKIRNELITKDLNIHASPVDLGLRDGLVSVNACDIVVSGDSLGMHMAIALKKWTVAWFGPTCAHEIDIFDCGVRVQTSASCSPCWRRSCQNSPMCYDLVDISEIVTGVKKGIQWLMSYSIPHLSAISYLPSPSLDTSKGSSQTSP
ncbi:MAG: heptosyltransferase [Bdellovibrionales bacterium RBG_16_40_8]|nr:MAG: heptosyltransferase [Bdellovibrionales bacterium RBG_16_40_8]